MASFNRVFKRSLCLVALSAFTFALSGCNGEPVETDDTDTAAETQDALEEANREMMQDYHDLVWIQKKTSAVDDYMAPDFVSHSSPPGTAPGPKAAREFVEAFFAGFPDITDHQDGLMADGDRVVIQWTIQGTNTGSLFGAPPSGKPMKVSGMDVLRVKDGKFVEHWGGLGDRMSDIFAQIQPSGSP